MKFKLFYRNAFSEFNAATLANLTDKQMLSISLEYGIDISRVRGVVDNANQILEVKNIKTCAFDLSFLAYNDIVACSN